MKGQMSFLMKGVFLILILVVVAVFMSQLTIANLSNAKFSESLDLNEKSITIAQLLTTSQSCLAYVESNGIESEAFSNVTQKVLDINKLNDFSANYNEIEPPCAKSYQYGYSVSVEAFESDVDTGVQRFHQDKQVWNFGTKSFSLGDALKESIEISFPVSIRISPTILQPGVLKLKIVKGELEELAGIINMVCDTGITSKSNLFFSYSTFTESSKLCQQLANKKVCRNVLCNLQMDKFLPGSYSINVKKSGNDVIVK